MSNEDFETNAKIFKALSDINRLKIIEILSCEEKCGCEILSQFDFTQPTLSHHMKILTDCNLVITKKEGTWNHYKLNCEKVRYFLNFIDGILSKK